LQERWSGSVKVIYLDRSAVKEAVRRAVRRLARARPEITKVMLFGSLARGDAVPGSDADLLVLLSKSDRQFLDRMSSYVLSAMPVGVDIFPYTEDELTRMTQDGNPFIRHALSEGIVIYERRRKQLPTPHSTEATA